MAETHLREGLLLGLGNPLLDISAVVDDVFLSKYGLKPNDAILAEEKHLPMYKEMVENYEVDYIAGGACQNTMRVGQWLLQSPKVFAFMGCIGKDSFGEILQSKAEEAGVLVSYQYHESVPTGTCAVLLTNKGDNRSLCANLSAANCFSKDHLDIPANRSLINNAQYFYITSFFLTVSPASIMDVAKHACEHNKPFCMNLSAPFLCTIFKDPMMEAFPFVDILFGNEQEALTFSNEHNFNTSEIAEIAKRIQQMPKQNIKRERIVIITQGENPVICATERTVIEYPAIHVPPKEIVDTNGAGDAFVGGFLAHYVQGKLLKDCIMCGVYAATEVIKQSGCSFPEKPNF